MQRQNVDNQRGEIEFRKRLSQQQTSGEKFFDDEYDQEAGKKLMKSRMEMTKTNMIRLRQRGIPLSPYLEIGAERGQRSLVMENEMAASGAAADLSFDMLRSCEYYKKVFGKSKMPMRLCCDAYNLPIRSKSLPFVFCYQTLHHFPEPRPILAEIYRVLGPGGYFCFDEEPYQRILHWNLYPVKEYSEEAQKRSIFRKALDRLFAENACNEVKFGIVENHEISTSHWRDSLRLFESNEAWLCPSSRASLRSELFNPTSRLKHFVAYLLGGSISGVCRKQANDQPGSAACAIEQALICPDCRLVGAEHAVAQNGSGFACTACAKQYPIVEGVVFLFEYRKFEELYPEVFSSIRKNLH